MRSLKSLQDAAQRAGPAAAASYTLIGAVVLLGGIGYALDRRWGTLPWCLLIGLALGFAVGFYELVMSTRPPDSSSGSSADVDTSSSAVPGKAEARRPDLKDWRP